MKYLLIFLISLCSIMQINAQIDQDFYFGKNISVNTEILSPGQLCGQKFGEWHFSHDQLINYMKYLDDHSDRITMVEYGRTYENRPLYTLFISSPENLLKLEELRKNHLNSIFSKTPIKNDSDPIIIWLGYGVHGNEASASNASLLTAYYLASSEEEHIKNTLSKSIIIIDPSLNPDGFNRAANWVNMHQSENWIADQNSIQFAENWPGGRTNHYWFDLNRDWLLAQHPESQGRLAVFHKWKPAVLTDHHEMNVNGTFFFQPGVLSRNNPLTPIENYTLNSKIAAYHAKSLDNIGSLYFSEEIFDDFYFGKGSSYPDINASIGILFEQSSINGQIVDNTHGTITFAQAIRNQFTVSLSTLKAAIENKNELQDYQRFFYTSTTQLVKNDGVKAYAFGCIEDPVRLNYLITLLQKHQIDVYRNNKSIKIKNTNYNTNEAFVVPLDQHQYRLIKSIFETQTEFKDSLFYDISTWTFPLSFNINYSSFSSTSGILGDKIIDTKPPEGKVHGEVSNIGYLFNWSNYNAPMLAQKLFNMNIKMKVASEPLQITIHSETKDFTYGSIFIPATNQNYNANELYKLMEGFSKENAVEIYALETGFRFSGIHFGSSNFIPLQAPKALMLVGNKFNSSSAGEIWHLLDQRLNIPLTRVDLNRFNRIDLFEYNTLIIPGGEFQFSKTESNKIEAWLRNGGVIIALGNSALELKNKEWIKLKTRSYQETDSTLRYDYHTSDVRRSRNNINGVILNAQIDPSHPIGYGFNSSTVPVFKNNSFVLEKNTDEYSCPVYIPKDALISGYLNTKNKKHLENSAYVLNYSIGKGKIIVFADNPNFRAVWYGTNKLFINALFFGNTIQGDR